MRRQNCRVCRDDRREEIDTRLRAGADVPTLARRLGIGRASLATHKLKCLDPAPETTATPQTHTGRA